MASIRTSFPHSRQNCAGSENPTVPSDPTPRLHKKILLYKCLQNLIFQFQCCPPAVVVEETTLSATTILPENEAATIAGAVVSQEDLLEDLGGEEVDGAQNTTSDGDEDLQAQPSQIREVIVEAPEVK